MNSFYSNNRITIYQGHAEEIRRELVRPFDVVLLDGPTGFHPNAAIEWLPWVADDGVVIVTQRDSWAMLGPRGDFLHPAWQMMPELAPQRELTHFAARPVEAIAALLAMTQGRILDPYMGVGSTLIAAKKLGRPAVGIERDKNWCGIAVERLEAQ